MSNRPSTSLIRTGLGISLAVLFGLGITGYSLAGRGSSPRQDESPTVALIDEPSTTSTSTPPASAATTVSTAPAPTRAEPGRPAAASARPVPVRPAPTGRAVRTLADAWIAAGAKGIDPDATPGPAMASGSAGPRPVRIEISAIGVAAPVDPAGTNGDGTLQVPTDFARTSYYTGRPVPGDTGPAVIVGHVDGRRGPAVFYRLRELRPGAEVRVHRSDGSVVTFTVERSKQVPKKAFPTDEVYGPTPDPTLRLITCGGSFDHRSGHYRDNTIVFLRLKG
jgi:hypothetical protein